MFFFFLRVGEGGRGGPIFTQRLYNLSKKIIELTHIKVSLRNFKEPHAGYIKVSPLPHLQKI